MCSGTASFSSSLSYENEKTYGHVIRVNESTSGNLLDEPCAQHPVDTVRLYHPARQYLGLQCPQPTYFHQRVGHQSRPLCHVSVRTHPVHCLVRQLAVDFHLITAEYQYPREDRRHSILTNAINSPFCFLAPTNSTGISCSFSTLCSTSIISVLYRSKSNTLLTASASVSFGYA